MKEIYYCPDCKNPVEEIAACGAANFFCNHCKKLVSKKAVLTQEEVKASDSQE